MKNILKSALVFLTAFSFATANAGELSVTGTAQASYGITSSDAAGAGVNAAKSIGVENDMTFKASGETDGGFA